MDTPHPQFLTMPTSMRRVKSLSFVHLDYHPQKLCDLCVSIPSMKAFLLNINTLINK